MDGASPEPHLPSELQADETPSERETMTVPLDYRPGKASDVLELDMGDGLILYNHDSSLVHHLNPSAAILWQLCDGQATVGQLAKEIAEEYGLGRDEVETQVSSVIAEFDALDLVQDARNLLPPDGDGRP